MQKRCHILVTWQEFGDQNGVKLTVKHLNELDHLIIIIIIIMIINFIRTWSPGRNVAVSTECQSKKKNTIKLQYGHILSLLFFQFVCVLINKPRVISSLLYRVSSTFPVLCSLISNVCYGKMPQHSDFCFAVTDKNKDCLSLLRKR